MGYNAVCVARARSDPVARRRCSGGLRLRAPCGTRRMTSPLTVERVQAIIARAAGPGRAPIDAGPETPLVDGGFWLDSVHLLEAIIACEAAFGIIFDPDTDFTGAHLSTVRTLHDLIRVKQST
jgi:acyl carrier protein